MDGGADTSVIGKGWEIESIHPTRKAHVLGFDGPNHIKQNLPIVSASCIVNIQGNLTRIKINEAVYNEGSQHSLLSCYQLREHRCKVYDTSKRHGGKQCMEIGELKIPFIICACLPAFNVEDPDKYSMEDFEPYVITSDEPWNPGRYHDHNSTCHAFSTELQISLDPPSSNDAHIYNDQNNIPEFFGKLPEEPKILGTGMGKALPAKIVYEKLRPYLLYNQ